MPEETTTTMTRDEVRLLMYLETRAVDYSGRIDDRHLNADDRAILDKWNKSGFVHSGRIASNFLKEGLGSTWAHLSNRAFDLVFRARMERAVRTWANRTWMTTSEKRNAGVLQDA